MIYIDDSLENGLHEIGPVEWERKLMFRTNMSEMIENLEEGHLKSSWNNFDEIGTSPVSRLFFFSDVFKVKLILGKVSHAIWNNDYFDFVDFNTIKQISMSSGKRIKQNMFSLINPLYSKFDNIDKAYVVKYDSLSGNDTYEGIDIVDRADSCLISSNKENALFYMTRDFL